MIIPGTRTIAGTMVQLAPDTITNHTIRLRRVIRAGRVPMITTATVIAAAPTETICLRLRFHLQPT